MDLDCHRIFISRDVLFHESIFPFYNSDFTSTALSLFDNIVLPTQLSTLHKASDTTTSFFPATHTPHCLPINPMLHYSLDNTDHVSNADALFPINPNSSQSIQDTIITTPDPA